MVVMTVVNMGIHVCECSGDHGYEALVRNDVPPIPFTKLRGEYIISYWHWSVISYYTSYSLHLYCIYSTSQVDVTVESDGSKALRIWLRDFSGKVCNVEIVMDVKC